MCDCERCITLKRSLTRILKTHAHTHTHTHMCVCVCVFRHIIVEQETYYYRHISEMLRPKIHHTHAKTHTDTHTRKTHTHTHTHTHTRTHARTQNTHTHTHTHRVCVYVLSFLRDATPCAG
jgi:hypothetical protein